MAGQTRAGNGFFGAAGVLLVLGAAGVGAYAMQESDAAASKMTATPASAVEASAAETSSPGKSEPAPTSDKAPKEGNLLIKFDGRELRADRAKLGSTRDSIGDALVGLKEQLDRGPVNAHMDLEARKVLPHVDGFAVDVFGSISAIEVALRGGASEVELEGVVVPAPMTIKELGISDISTVIGDYTTKFSVGEKVRSDNLKLLASKINGMVLQPGENFSFNGTTGMRRLEDGFKMAHVISEGQFVDGMAGGSCQISSTLHGAAFFGGLDIESVTPHSRPSTYVTLGLDATVVAGRVDLKLRNPYDFPIVIHYRVARGESNVEILGKEKPFDEIEFERTIDKRIDFQTVTREDSGMGMGNMVVEQPGYPGYKLTKIRRTYKDGKVIKTDKWKLAYQPVVEYARLGINPNPNLPAPKASKLHGPKPTSGTFSERQ